MKKIIFLFVFVISSPVLAENSSNEGVYGSISLFGVSLQDVDIEASGSVTEDDFDFGFGSNVAVGYQLGNGVRLEGEMAYRGNPDSGDGVDGNYNTLAFMGNGFYDFYMTNAPIKPYIGAGVGIATASDFSVPGVGKDSPDPAFAYQAMAGISYELSHNSDIIIGYRYFAVPGNFSYEISGVSIETSYDTHNFEIGYRARF